VLIRREAAGDAGAIRAVTAAAFSKPGAAGLPAEATLVDELRAGDAWLPALSLVAVDGAGEVIGHVVCTRGHAGQAPVLGLGSTTAASGSASATSTGSCRRCRSGSRTSRCAC